MNHGIMIDRSCHHETYGGKNRMAITNRMSNDYGLQYVTEPNVDTKKTILGSLGAAAAAKQYGSSRSIDRSNHEEIGKREK
jgi:hypothetical protein